TPRQFLGGIFVAAEGLGSRRVQEDGAVPRCLRHSVIDLHVRVRLITEFGQGQSAGGPAERPFLQRYPVEIRYSLASLAEIRQDLAARAQCHRTPAVHPVEEGREHRDGGLALAEPP